MAEWEGWHLEEKSFYAFPNLRKFQIYRCPKLRPLLPIFSTSLQELYVDECSNLSNWLEILPASIVTLKSALAEWVNEMPSFPNLECLGIRGDGRVSELSSHLVKLGGALRTVEIQNCTPKFGVPSPGDGFPKATAKTRNIWLSQIEREMQKGRYTMVQDSTHPKHYNWRWRCSTECWVHKVCPRWITNQTSSYPISPPQYVNIQIVFSTLISV